MQKTVLFLLITSFLLAAGCDNRRDKAQEHHPVAVQIDSIYSLLITKNQHLAQSDWREARALLYPGFFDENPVSPQDSSLLNFFEQSAVRTGRDYYSKAYRDENTKNQLSWLLIAFAILLLVAGTVIGRIVYRRKQLTNQAREEALQKLALSLSRQVNNLQNEQEVLQQQFAKGLQSRYQEMGELFKTVAGTNADNRPVKQGLLYEKVRKAMAAFLADENGKVLLEEQLNQSFDQLMAHFRTEFPGRSEDYYRFAAYLFAGFDKDTVTAFTGIHSRDAIYSRKKRLRQEISNSSVPHKAQFMHFLSLTVAVLLGFSCSKEPICTVEAYISDSRVEEGTMAVAKASGKKDQVSAPVSGSQFTLRLPRNKQTYWSIDFYDGEGKHIGTDEMDLFLSVVPDTKRMTLHFDTKQISGSPLTAELNQLSEETLHAFDWTQEMTTAQHAGNEVILEKLMQGSQKRFSDLLFKAWREHPHDAVGLQAVKWIAPMLSHEELEALLETADGFIRQDPDILAVMDWTNPSDEAYSIDGLLGKGTSVLALFWAGWSEASRRELQKMEQVFKESTDSGLNLAGVNVSDTRAAMEQTLSDLNISFNQFFDPYGRIPERFGIDSIPCVVLFNPEGIIVQQATDVHKIHLSFDP